MVELVVHHFGTTLMRTFVDDTSNRLQQVATGPLTLACIRTIWKHEVLLYRRFAPRIVHKRWNETIERPARTSDRHACHRGCTGTSTNRPVVRQPPAGPERNAMAQSSFRTGVCGSASTAARRNVLAKSVRSVLASTLMARLAACYNVPTALAQGVREHAHTTASSDSWRNLFILGRGRPCLMG